MFRLVSSVVIQGPYDTTGTESKAPPPGSKYPLGHGSCAGVIELVQHPRVYLPAPGYSLSWSQRSLACAAAVSIAVGALIITALTPTVSVDPAHAFRRGRRRWPAAELHGG
jgi:hypothetical protein